MRMEEDIELKFPLDDDGARTDSAWPLEQEPTDLLVLWPGGDDAPTQTEVLAALRTHLGDGLEILEEVEPPSPDVQWAIAARFAGHSVPLVIWTQPAAPVPEGELGDPAAETCRWVIGFESLLVRSDPLSSYMFLMKILASAFAQAPAILDLNSTMVLSREHLDEAYGESGGASIEPAADELWMIHAVHAPEEGRDPNEPSGVVWLHTHGLWRCGLPELEMLEVPAANASTAAELLNDVAALMFEFPPPAPGEPYAVGDELDVTFQPWQEVVRTMDSSVPGGHDDRQGIAEENPHVGVRAVVCGAAMRGSFRQVWTWPREVVERLESDDATIYMTQRATRRQARMARMRWGEFATAFVAAQKAALIDVENPSAVFLLKAGFPVDEEMGSDGSAKEHLWFEAHRFNGDGADATLINQPVSVGTLKRGDRVHVRRDEISDWQVQTVAGSFGPQDVSELWRAIDSLRPGVEQATNDASES